MIKIEIKNDGELSSFVIKKGREVFLLNNLSDNDKVKLLGSIAKAYELIKYSMQIKKV